MTKEYQITKLRNEIHIYMSDFITQNDMKVKYFPDVSGSHMGAYGQFKNNHFFSLEGLINRMCKANPEFEKKYHDFLFREFKNYIINNYNKIDDSNEIAKSIESKISKLQEELAKIKNSNNGE